MWSVIKWLFNLPGRCDKCEGKNKIAYGPTFSFEYCPNCKERKS